MLQSISSYNTRGETTATEELHLLCYWRQLGNKWVEIAKFMGRSENWVKNNWKRVLKREGIAMDDKIDEKIRLLIGQLRESLQTPSRMVVDPTPPVEELDEIMSLGNLIKTIIGMKDVEDKDWPEPSLEEEKLGGGTVLSDTAKLSSMSKSLEYDQNEYYDPPGTMGLDMKSKANMTGVTSSTGYNYSHA